MVPGTFLHPHCPPECSLIWKALQRSLKITKGSQPTIRHGFFLPEKQCGFSSSWRERHVSFTPGYQAPIGKRKGAVMVKQSLESQMPRLKPQSHPSATGGPGPHLLPISMFKAGW